MTALDAEELRESEARLKYLSRLLQFRLSVARNLGDAEATGRLIYLFDSNVVLTLLSPGRNLQPFLPPGIDRPRRDGHATALASAIVAGEFLLSGRLPAQGPLPIYIAPEHAAELHEHLNAQRDELRERMERAEASIVDGRTLGDELKELRRTLREAKQDSRRIVKLLSQTLPRLIARHRLPDIVAMAHMQRLLSARLLRPLAGAPFLDGDLMRPGDGMLSEWGGILERVGGDRTRNVSHDVAVMARLETLDRHCRSSGIDAQFVLVTQDAKLHVAMAERVRRSVARGEGTMGWLERPPLRHVRQYGPLINTADMQGLAGPSPLTTEIAEVIDGLFAFSPLFDIRQRPDWLHVTSFVVQDLLANFDRNVRRGDADIDRRVARSWLALVRQRFDTLLRKDIRSSEEELKPLWRKLSDLAIGSSAPLLMRHFESVLDGVDELVGELTAEGIGGVMQTEQSRLLDRIDRQHARWANEALVGLARRRAAEDAPFPWRPLTVRLTGLVPEVEGLGGAELVEAIAGVGARPPGTGLRDAFAVAMADRDLTSTFQMLFGTAVLAFTLDEWTVAKEYADRARSHAGAAGGIGALEAEFLETVARRRSLYASLLAAPQAAERVAASAELAMIAERGLAGMDGSPSDPLVRARWSIEVAHLVTRAHLIARFEPRLSFLSRARSLPDPTQVPGIVLDGLAKLDEATAGPSPDDETTRVGDLLRVQAGAVLSTLQVVSLTELHPVALPPERRLGPMLARTAAIGGRLGVMPSARWPLERAVATLYSDPAPTEDACRRVASRITTALDGPGGGMDLIDRAFLGGFREAVLKTCHA